MQQALHSDFARFFLVGLSGLIINFVLLTLLYRVFGLPIFLSQLIAAEIALFNNFWWHNKWTYKRHTVTKSFPRLLSEFHATSWVAIIGSSLLISFLVSGLHFMYEVAFLISSAAGLIWNFGTTKFYVWRNEQQAVKEEK